jgi:hypothetical protein
MTEIKPVPVEKYQSGYIPQWQYRTEDCYIWKDHPKGTRTSLNIDGGPWILRVNKRYTGHRTLIDARIEASRQLGVRP